MLAFILLAVAVFASYELLNKPNPPAEGQKVIATIVGSTSTEAQNRPPNSKAEFGWLTFIANPLYRSLRFLHEHGVGNWGWAIIVFTVAFNFITLWPRIVSVKSSLKMMRIQPKVDALKERYAGLKFDDPKRVEMNQRLAALYKVEGVNMYGGCLPMLLQMPLLFAYVRVLQNALELHHANWLWLADLSKPDPLHILPITIIGSMVLVQYMTPSPTMDSTQRWMLAIVAPLIMGFTLWHYASGLALYWVTCNFFNLTFQLLINRSHIGREMRAIAAERAQLRPRGPK